jgi:hypothetical protein
VRVGAGMIAATVEKRRIDGDLEQDVRRGI